MMNRFIYRLSLLLLLVSSAFLQSCKDDDATPRVVTVEVQPLSSDSFLAKGNLVSSGTLPVLDHGFVYGYDTHLSVSYSSKIALGPQATKGHFTGEATGIPPAEGERNHTFNVRAYLTNEQGTIYGEVLSVSLPSPSIQSVSPASGQAGDLVTIHGQFLSKSPDLVRVYFNQVDAEVKEVSETKVVAVVPERIQYGHANQNPVNIQVRIGGMLKDAPRIFKLYPGFTAMEQTTGPVRSALFIHATNLPPHEYAPFNVKLFFGSVQIKEFNYVVYPAYIAATVPHNIGRTSFPVTVQVEGKTYAVPGEFTVTPHRITGLSKTSGMPGTTLTITGEHLAPHFDKEEQRVLIGGHQVTNVLTDLTSTVVRLPLDIPEGEHQVQVQYGPHTVTATQKFTVVSPTITSFSPQQAGLEQVVLFQGYFEQDQVFQVNFGSVKTVGGAISPTTMRVHVPEVAPGNVKLSVTYGNRTLLADAAFTVLRPALSSFSPSSGVPGTPLTIMCEGFTPNSNTTVKLGNTQVGVRSFTGNSISVLVPSSLPPGPVKITLQHFFQVINSTLTMTSTDSFTVTN